jgi:tetraacyldisaccharide 4'-kinase
LLKAEDSGDEAFMMAQKLKHIPVLVGQNRFKSGMQAINRFKANVILLDDGFQHLKLKRDIDLVLLDDTRPLGNGHMFPSGMLREPVSALERADACVLTRCRPGDARRPGLGRGPFFRTCHKPYLVRVVPAGSGAVSDDAIADVGLELIRGCRVMAFSGIARNDEFCRMLKTLGCDLAGFARFPDHHWYCPEDIDYLLNEIKKTGAGMLITTDKDYARIHGKIHWPVDLVVIGIKISFNDQTDAFRIFLKKRLADFCLVK